MNLPLEESYRYCHEVSRSSGSSFYRSFTLLAPPRRRAMEALYAFARWTDDLSDREGSIAEKRERLEQWRNTLQQLNLSESSLNMTIAPLRDDSYRLWPALHDSILRYNIPVELLEDLIEGVLTDLDQVRLQTQDQLHRYCYCVAGTVGLACLHIWEGPVESIRPLAIDCGYAFQVTNILRDLLEDAQRGRIYLPAEDLQRFHCESVSWLSGNPAGNWNQLIAEYLQRAENAFQNSWRIHGDLQGDGKRMFSLMWHSYHTLLKQIARDPGQVWKRRTTVPSWKKVMLILSHFGPWRS
jgi:phytoene synthase